MAKTIDLSDYKKKQLGDRQLYLNDNNVVVAERFHNIWLYYAVSNNIRVVEDGGTIRIIVDD